MIENLATKTAEAIELTRAATTRWSSRLAGSEACLACGDHLEQTLSQFCDQTETQSFSVRPAAFLGYIRINIVLFVIALIALWLDQRLCAVVASTLALVILVLEFFFYWEFVDFLFPRKTGKNVWGTIEPAGEVRQQIYVTAHHDSAHVFNFLQNNAKWYMTKVVAGLSALFAMAAISWLLLLGRSVGLELSLVATLAKLGFVAWTPLVVMLWFFYADQGTPGAGDNMICTAVTLQIGQHFSAQKQQGAGLEHTRLVIGSWDAEESGLRGARAFVQQHHTELHSVKTYNFNLECLYDHRQMTLLTSDLNSFVPLSEPMAEQCSQLAREQGFEVQPIKFPFLAGGTDAAEFAKSGIEATTLAAMNWTDKGDLPAYHTTRDTIDAVDPVAVERSIELGIRYIVAKEQEVRS